AALRILTRMLIHRWRGVIENGGEGMPYPGPIHAAPEERLRNTRRCPQFCFRSPVVEDEPMAFARGITGLLVIDPYNDFISEGGKLWDRLRGVAEANHCVPHMMQILDAARKAGIRVFY